MRAHDAAVIVLPEDTGVTLTVALAGDDVPPVPMHVTEYVAFVVGLTDTEPDVPEAVNPLPVQEVAFCEDQVSVAEPPEVIDDGLAERDAVAAGMVAARVLKVESPETVGLPAASFDFT